MPSYQFTKDQIKEQLSKTVSEWLSEQNTEESAKEIKRELQKNRNNIIGELLGFKTGWSGNWGLGSNKAKITTAIQEKVDKYFERVIKDLVKEKTKSSIDRLVRDCLFYSFEREVKRKIDKVLTDEAESISSEQILSEIEHVYSTLKGKENG